MRANIIILGCLCLLTGIFGSEEKNETVFVPTREWQTVKKGTPIPEGLHVRHNFLTGVTEAKLMDNEDTEEKSDNENVNHSQSKSLSVHVDDDTLGSVKQNPSEVAEKSGPLKYSIRELKARLKKIKEEEIKTTADLNDVDTETKVKQKFRDYETLKKELEGLDIQITTDSELLTNYFQEFQSHKNGVTMGSLTSLEIEEVLDILHNLENLLHQIDNAIVFADMQGMSKIISPCLNGTNNEIKAEALRVLGAAVQSNPKVQIKALESDFVQKILHILSTNNKIDIKSRCLFALSALIRNFPAAQKVWIDHGGLEIFGKILVGDQLQIQTKVMKLINDLITERQHLDEISDPEYREQKTKAYAVTEIEKKLLVHEYCKRLSELTTKRFQNEIDTRFKDENHEFLETISESMVTIASICKSIFENNKNSLFPVINDVLQFYQSSSDGQEENEILRHLTFLVAKLQTADPETPRDEL